MISTQFVRPCGGKKKNSLIVYDLNKKCHWLQDYASTLLGEESGNIKNSEKAETLQKVDLCWKRSISQLSMSRIVVTKFQFKLAILNFWTNLIEKKGISNLKKKQMKLNIKFYVLKLI